MYTSCVFAFEMDEADQHLVCLRGVVFHVPRRSGASARHQFSARAIGHCQIDLTAVYMVVFKVFSAGFQNMYV